MNKKDIPNLISIGRIALVVPVVYCLLTQHYDKALWLFVIAGISDALDGFIAKHYHYESRLGSILDPLADKLLLVSSFASLTYLGLIPYWLLWLVFARDLIIILGGISYHYCYGRFTLVPVWSSKINTVLQVLFVVLVISAQLITIVSMEWVHYMAYMVMLSVMISGVEYIIIWGKKAWQQHKTPPI